MRRRTAARIGWTLPIVLLVVGIALAAGPVTRVRVWGFLDAEQRDRVRAERQVLEDIERANPELVVEETGFSDGNGYLHASVHGDADLRPPSDSRWDEQAGSWSGLSSYEGQIRSCQIFWDPDHQPELTVSCWRA